MPQEHSIAERLVARQTAFHRYPDCWRPARSVPPGRCQTLCKPRYFDLGMALAAFPLPRSGAKTDIRTPPPTARQPDQRPNAVPDTDCSGDPDTVSPACLLYTSDAADEE